MSKLIYNGLIWQGEDAKKDISWMVIDADTGLITRTPTHPEESAPKDEFATERTYDLGGKRVLPGLNEAHIHLSEFGAVLLSADFSSTSSIDQLRITLKKYVDSLVESSWIVGYSMDNIKIGKFPTKQDIDAVCADRPVVIHRVCLHTCVVNSKALQLLGLTNDSKDPDGGRLGRFEDSHANKGELNGVLYENATHLAMAKVSHSKDDRKKHILAAQEFCIQHGVTSVQTIEDNTWDIYLELLEEGSLKLRVNYVPYFFRNGAHPKYLPPPGTSVGHNGMLTCDRVKLFADGAIGPRTAALSVPYRGTDEKGMLIYSKTELQPLVSAASGLGYRLEIHVIGDRAVDDVLDSLESSNVAAEKRPILTHCQVIRTDQIPRLVKQGVIANIQPQFLVSDYRYIETHIPEQLLASFNRIQSLMESGVTVAGGSDAPIEEPIPFLAMYDSMFRHGGLRQPSSPVSNPTEIVSIGDALAMYTVNAAFTMLQERHLGKLQPGYIADFITIRSTDVDVCSNPSAMRDAEVDEVWMGGKQIVCN